MRVIEQPSAMRAWSDERKRCGHTIGLVPTMGYLHEGHLALVREVRRRADSCVASIFVNPLQFGPKEDLDRYPRDLDGDAGKLAAEGVEILYLPQAAAVYPQGFQTEVAVFQMTRELCGNSRPGHFNGVTTVVAKLFNTVRPDLAAFGEKDFQQLATIRRMVTDLDFGIEIIGVPIVRESDGLAMSSRNAYLSERERRAARCLSRALEAARAAVRGGERSSRAVLREVHEVLGAEPLARIDYAEIVDPMTIDRIETIDDIARLALAVHVGGTRLIDNAELEVSGG